MEKIHELRGGGGEGPATIDSVVKVSDKNQQARYGTE